jgi:hypothetical protein
MIIFDKGVVTEQEIRDMTKDILGIRYRTNKDKSFESYSNIFTMIADICKWIKKKLT